MALDKGRQLLKQNSIASIVVIFFSMKGENFLFRKIKFYLVNVILLFREVLCIKGDNCFRVRVTNLSNLSPMSSTIFLRL